MSHVFFSAGEVSGDKYAAHLLNSLKKRFPKIQATAIGGTHLASSGATLLSDLTKISTIGLLEPLKYLPSFYSAYIKACRFLECSKPDVFIPVDFQGFNLKLAKKATSLGIPVVYFISPQEWQWGSEKGGRIVASCTDKILSIFSQELPFYERVGANPIFVGHPLLDIAKPKHSKDVFLQKNKLSKTRKIVSLFPGSRTQEIRHIAPIVFKSAQMIQKENEIQICLGVAAPHLQTELSALASAYLDPAPTFITEDTYDLIAYSDASLCCSGTITLEHAILGTPFVSAYRFSPLSYCLLTLLFKKKFQERLRYFSLPNLLVQASIIPEFLQDSATPHALSNAIGQILGDMPTRQKILEGFEKVRQCLGPEGCFENSAKEISEYL